MRLGLLCKLPGTLLQASLSGGRSVLWFSRSGGEGIGHLKIFKAQDIYPKALPCQRLCLEQGSEFEGSQEDLGLWGPGCFPGECDT